MSGLGKNLVTCNRHHSTTMIKAFLPCSFCFTYFLLLYISTFHFVYFSLQNIVHLFRVPTFCLVLPSFSLRFFICSTHFAFLFLHIFFYFSFPFISFLTPTFSCYLSRPIFSSCFFSLIRFRLLFLHFTCPFYPYLVFPGFLLPLFLAVCCRQLSLQGRLVPYFCPC
jgi:hypothetical protein